MAQRRMFSLKIIETDAFMGMPLSAQALYFHLGMRADDDGFVSNARTIQRLVGASDDDFRILLMKRFILAFDSGVVVIKHWRINNYVRGDRYTPTLYQEEKSQLYVKKNGVYTDHPLLPPPPAAADRLPPESPADYQRVTNGIPSDIPDDIPDDTKRDTQVRLGEVRSGKVSKGKDSIGKYYSGDGGTRGREAAENEVDEYLIDRQMEPTAFFGVSEDDVSEATALTHAIFSRFTNREPTKADSTKVFFATYQQVQNEAGEYSVVFPKERKRLLIYAFEQAMNAGKPGDWRYIDGVLRRMHQRGIVSLDGAEDFEYQRGNG